MNNPEIRFIKNKDIDIGKWDQCIDNSPFGIAYAKTWYLDRICPHWDALVWGEYLYIMPLVNSRKFGISYVYQPFFTQQLGIFSVFEVGTEIVNQFLNAIPAAYKLTDMKLNLGNLPSTTAFKLQKNTTYQLSLQPGSKTLQENYSSNTKRNIQKAIRNKIWISPVYDLLHFLDFTQLNLREKSPEIKPEHYQALQRVISYAIYHQSGELYGAWDSTNNLVAAVFFLTSNRKSIYLAASSNNTGIEESAMFLLIDTFIRNNSGKDIILDFEGSNLSGIARFYAGFGAKPQVYYSVHQNRLPKVLRIFKS